MQVFVQTASWWKCLSETGQTTPEIRGRERAEAKRAKLAQATGDTWIVIPAFGQGCAPAKPQPIGQAIASGALYRRAARSAD